MSDMLQPSEISNETFERQSARAKCDADIAIPEVFMREILGNPDKEIFTYRSEGGNLLAARRVMWSPGRFRIDFILNPER